MIVLFTSNKSGGIVQLTHTLAQTLCKMGQETVVFCREDAQMPTGSYKIERFAPIRTLLAMDKAVVSVADRIVCYHPDCVIFTDDAVPAAVVLLAIRSRARCVLSVHDVTSHSGVRTRFLNRVKRIVKMFPVRRAYVRANDILLYSKTSAAQFAALYPKYADKSVVMRLGAHLVTEAERMPKELVTACEGYALFFGRIDGYKGVDDLLSAYRSHPALCQRELIVAGRATMDFPWLTNDGLPRCRILNRFIDDEEMNWLFSHASFLILPYKDASQSGVIPIAYHYGKPVLISNLDGLREYVEDGKTGRVYSSREALADAVLSMYGDAASMSMGARQYSENLKWEKSVGALLEKLL